MAYSLSLQLEEDYMRIPVNPGSIDIKESGNSKTYDVAGLGEINVIGSPRLSEISFESIFPAANHAFVVGKHQEPYYYLSKIETWMALKQPVRFVFAGSTFDINKLVSIERFDWHEAGGAVGDIQYSITLKKYIPYAARKMEVQAEVSGKQAASAQPPPRPDNRPKAKTYTLVKGDNLWKVAQKFLGNGARYKEIQKLNGIKDSQLTKLPIGMVVKLP